MALPVNSFTPLTFEQANPFLTGANQSMQYLSNALSAPYSAKLADAEIKQKLAEAALNQFYVNNPLLKLTGDASQVGALAWLAQHPDINNLAGGNSGGNTGLTTDNTGAPTTITNLSPNMGKPSPTLSTGGPVGNPGFTNKGYPTAPSNLTSKPASLTTLPLSGGQINTLKNIFGQGDNNTSSTSTTNAPSSTAPSTQQTSPGSGSTTGDKPKTLSDILSSQLSAKQNNMTTRAELNQKQVNGYNWAHAPITVKNAAIAQLAGAGVDPIEANARLASGEQVSDILREKGFDPNNPPQPDYLPTTGNVTDLKKRQAALASVNAVAPFIRNGLAPFVSTLKGYSIPAIKDALLGRNVDQQANFLAALALQQELAMIRTVMAGGRVTRSGIEDMIKASMGAIHPFQTVVNKDAYLKSQQLIDDQLTKMVDASNQSMTQIKPQASFDSTQTNFNVPQNTANFSAGQTVANPASTSFSAIGYTPPPGKVVVVSTSGKTQGQRFLVPAERAPTYLKSGLYIKG